MNRIIRAAKLSDMAELMPILFTLPMVMKDLLIRNYKSR